MKSSERFGISNHLAGALAETPIKGSQVREAHDALEVATAKLMRAELAFGNAKGLAADASARVRDATKKASRECRKARGLLISKGVELAPRSAPSKSQPDLVVRRAEVLIEKGASARVKFPALEAARAELLAALRGRGAARSAKREASEAQSEARSEWDVSYGVLRAVIEAELRRLRLTGDKLAQRVAVYFPPSAERSSTPARPQAPPMPAGGGDAAA